MCFLPFSRLFSCCCGSRDGFGKKRVNQRTRNTRVRIAGTGADKLRSSEKSLTSVSGRQHSSHHRRRNTTGSHVSHNGTVRKRRSRSGSHGESNGELRRRRRSRNLDDEKRSSKSRVDGEKRPSSRKSATEGSAVKDAVIAAAAATAAETVVKKATGESSKTSKHRKRAETYPRRDDRSNLTANKTEDEEQQSYLIADKQTKRRRRRSSGASGLHDDSGYRTEEKRHSSKSKRTAKEATSNVELDYSPMSMEGKRLAMKRSATDFDYNPRGMDGGALEASVVAEQDKDKDKDSPVRGILRKSGRKNRSEDSSGVRVNMVNMLDHDMSDKEAYNAARDERRKLTRSKSTGHAADRAESDSAKQKSRHRKRSNSSAAVEASSRAAAIAAEATRQTKSNNDGVLRRRSTRNKPIRLEDVDIDFEDPSESEAPAAPADEAYVASDDTYVDEQPKKRSPPRRRRRSSAGADDSVVRSKSNRESSTKKKRSSKITGEETERHHRKSKSSPESKRRSRTESQPEGVSRSKKTSEFTLDNLANLAAQGIEHRHSLLKEAGHRSSKSIQLPKPAFTYPENVRLPRTEPEYGGVLLQHIQDRNLRSLIPSSSPRIPQIARTAATRAAPIARSLYLSEYATPDLAKLGLYDVIVFCDNSTSMYNEERWGTLKTVVRRIARISSAYDPSGIKIRFLNSKADSGFNGIVTEDQVETCLDAVTLASGSAIGTRLFEKVVRPEIIDKAARGELVRPVLVSVVTDGEPVGEHVDTLKNTILAAKNELAKLTTPNGGRFGPGAVAFEIARVGSSSAAKRYVQSLAEDKHLKGFVYCTDESLDWALGEAEDAGQLNCWLTQVLARGIMI